MLTREPPDRPDDLPATEYRTRPVVIAFLVFVFLLVLALRHDYWNWDTPGYLLFGFLPVGLWWQALVSILASIMMWLMVRLAWPAHLERDALMAEQRRTHSPSQTPTHPPDPHSPR